MPPQTWKDGKWQKVQTVRQELDNIYGANAPAAADSALYETLLKYWDDFSSKQHISYALAYGTALGYARHPQACFIPFDGDADVFVGSGAIAILDRLASSPEVPEVQYTSKGLNESLDIQIVMHPDWKKPHGDLHRSRYDCKGNRVLQHVDHCAFSGPLARIISKTPQSVPGSSGVDLPAVENCLCGGLATKCFSHSELHGFLRDKYGKNYLMPPQTWKDGRWH